MILLIDNYDSFTYNIVHYVEELNFKVKVFRNDKITLNQIISEMIENDHNEAKKEILLKNKGFTLPNSLESIPKIMNDDNNIGK